MRIGGVRRQIEQIAQHDHDPPATRRPDQRVDGPLDHGGVGVRGAARLDLLERHDDALELIATARARDGRDLRPSRDERDAHRLAARERDARERRGEERRERDLRRGGSRPAIAHRRRRIDEKRERAVRLRLELPDDESIVAKERPAVEPAQVVARYVLAVPAELDPRAPQRAAVHAGVYALGDLPGA